MSALRLLIISNGHGEDMLATVLARPLFQSLPGVTVDAFPLVGIGGAYDRAGIRVVGVQRSMPTGGFIMKGPTNVFKDLKAGLLALTRRQIRELKQLRDGYDAVVAVGDVYPLWLGGRYARLPLLFVPTAKSEYIEGHFAFEYRMMRRYARRIFPRDARTAEAMQARGLPAAYVGNLMMDALDGTGDRFGLKEGVPVVTMLPGSREDALINVKDLVTVARHVKAQNDQVQFLFSVAPGLDEGAFRTVMREGGIEAVCASGPFGDVLRAADVVVGLAGTANEQAAGLGKPVITFVGRGTQFTRKFATDQKKLLGDAVSLVTDGLEAVASEVWAILHDDSRRQHMAVVGRERMGEPGAAVAMARQIAAQLADVAY